MKHLVILTVGVCLVISAACAPAPEPVAEAAPESVFDKAVEEAAIRKVVEQGYAAINDHDAKTMFDQAVTDFESWSEELKGREAITESWVKRFEQQPGDQRNMTEELSIRFFSPEVAVHKHRMENTGRVGEDGKPLPPREYLEALVLVKKEGKWWMAANYWMVTKE